MPSPNETLLSSTVFPLMSTRAADHQTDTGPTGQESSPSGPQALGLNDVSDILWYVVPPILLVFGTFGNVMIVVVMRGMRASQSTACLSVYFIALAVSDQCLLLTSCLYFWIDLGFTWPPSFFSYDLLCTIPWFFSYTCSVTSAWFLVAMTYQRVTSVVAPHRVGILCTVRRGKVVIVTIVSVACVVNSHFFFTHLYRPEHKECLPSERISLFIDAFTFLDLCLASVIPFLLLIVGNSVLIKQVLTSLTLSWSMRSKAMLSATTAGTTAEPKKVYPMTVTLILTSSAFLLLSLPTCVFDTYLRVKEGEILVDKSQTVLKLMEAMTMFLWFTVSASNFYLYVLSGRKFREEAKRYLCCGKEEHSK